MQYPLQGLRQQPLVLKTRAPSQLLTPGYYNVPMPVRIRDFHSQDFETLWRIDQQCFAPGISYSRPELSAYMRAAGSFTLVAESGELEPLEPQLNLPSPPVCEIIGFLVGHANRRGAGHIITIDVLPQARRVGVGSRLLSTAEERLRAARCATVRLETAVDNPSALAFYKRHHYSLLKTIPRYYPGDLDAFVLEKDLLSRPPER